MRIEEYDALARVEREHWFYSGKRELVRRWIGRYGLLRPTTLLVDVGAGTGLFASEMQRYCRTVAIDPDPSALRHIAERAGLATIAAPAGQLPLATGVVDALTALDVIEHLDDDVGALQEFGRVLRPGGLLVITVPALPALWSEWDEALGHRRRYTRPTLQLALQQAPFEICQLNYINTLALLPIAAYRLARRMGVPVGSSRLEDQVPPEPLNGVLRRVFVEPAMWPIPMPLGVSLLAILKRSGG
ncbi:MAG: methyltransferase domain-containing protein [Chloroflexi bacterium]|nr:methyltransferase domain-containing protein [Chloroflexota bacterium]